MRSAPGPGLHPPPLLLLWVLFLLSLLPPLPLWGVHLWGDGYHGLGRCCLRLVA